MQGFVDVFDVHIAHYHQTGVARLHKEGVSAGQQQTASQAWTRSDRSDPVKELVQLAKAGEVDLNELLDQLEPGLDPSARGSPLEEGRTGGGGIFGCLLLWGR